MACNPLAEETGVIVDIGDWVFRDAAKEVKRIRSKYHPRFQISINKSPIHFRTPRPYTDKWIALLSSLGLSSNAIIIEITESPLLDAT
jgi:EAL domain-containing protein (putative c-di-GMP-specific phosphodiesterase class I)